MLNDSDSLVEDISGLVKFSPCQVESEFLLDWDQTVVEFILELSGLGWEQSTRGKWVYFSWNLKYTKPPYEATDAAEYAQTDTPCGEQVELEGRAPSRITLQHI